MNLWKNWELSEMTAEERFREIGQKIEGAQPGKLFGKPCFKINGKAFCCFFQGDMVFKLTGEEHAEALALEGARLFDPTGKGRPMKEWVQVPDTHEALWQKLAEEAAAYVG